MINNIFEWLKRERDARLKGGLYHYTQIKFAYNSNRIEGSKLTEDQTRYIYDTFTINTKEKETASVNDIIETVNHFKCFNYMINVAKEQLSQEMIKEFHKLLKQGSKDSFDEWFKVGDYKNIANTVAGIITTPPKNVEEEMGKLISKYLAKDKINIYDIVDFHYNFEKIHPFQDGNGRVGRLVMFKECLKYDIVPFVIEDEQKLLYYGGLKEYPESKLRLMDFCLLEQDKYKDIIKQLNVDVNNKGFLKNGDDLLNNNNKLLNDMNLVLNKNNIKEMCCYDYEKKKEIILNFKEKELNVKSMEVILQKENLSKFECNDENGKLVYILQRIKKDIAENWYFYKDFNKDSAIFFINSFYKEREKQNNQTFRNGTNTDNNGNGGGGR